MPALLELTDRVFGQLRVESFVGYNKYGKALWNCLCSCGKSKVVLSNSLQTGRTSSCGCAIGKSAQERFTKHGHKSSRATPEERSTYSCWIGIRERCYNPNSSVYEYYGERGITVCDRWRASYDDFLADMEVKPSLGLSIERRDCNGNYEPSNCYWATYSVQNANKRCFENAQAARKDKEELEQLYESGVSQTQLAEYYDVSHSTVRRILGVM